MTLLKFEDVVIGDTRVLGEHRFERDEIIAFATDFDPQPFHLDEEAAKQSLFGALCASGWHTAAACMGLMVRWRDNAESLPWDVGLSPGFLDLKWKKPVFVGDTIRYVSRVSEKVALKSRPEWGLVRNRVEGTNQHGDLVYSFTGQVFVRRR